LSNTCPGLERLFPKLLATEYKIKEARQPRYNCLALVAGKKGKWVQPTTLTNGLIQYLEDLGWRVCDTGESKTGVTKMCIYVDQYGDWTHACLQTQKGKWLSKLGNGALIEHNAADALEGTYPAYGQCKYFMQRRRCNADP